MRFETLLLLTLAATSFLFAEAKVDTNAVTQANNPLANMKALNFHNYYMGELTETDKSADQLWVRYVQPFSLGGTAANEGRLDAALDGMGLSGLDGVPVQVLSQGQKRRTALCRLLVSDRPLWVLDEPFTALDKGAVATIRDAIAAHVAEGGMAVLTTHQEVGLDVARTKTLGLGG